MKLDLLSSASLLALGGALTLSAPTAANAALTCGIISGNHGQCTGTYSLGNTLTDVTNAQVNVDQFNATTGNLTSIVVTESATYDEHNTVTNQTASPFVGATFSLALTLIATGAPGAFPTITLGATSPYQVTHHFDVAASGSVSFNSTNNPLVQTATDGFGGSLPNYAVLSSSFTGFIGTGTFAAYFTSYTSQTVSSPGNLAAALSTYINPSLSVTYDYTVNTPEPTTLALIGVGLSGLGVVRRRRKR